MAVRKVLVQTDESPVGKAFVVGNPNAKGEFVIVLGERRWRIRLAPGVVAGERVKVVSVEDDWLHVASVKAELEAFH